MSPSKLCCGLAFLWSVSSPAAIGGLYGTSCQALDELSFVKDIYLEDGRFELVQTIFSDPLCQVPAYDFVFAGEYFLEESSQAIDLHFTAIELTPLAPRIAEAFTLSELCGLSDWSMESAQDVSARVCGSQAIPALGQTVFASVREVGSGIQLGALDAEDTGLTPAERPRRFETLIYEAR